MKNLLITLRRMVLSMSELNTDKGLIYTEGEIEVGAAAFIEGEGEETPAPDGEYVAEDGRVLVIADGVITEIKEAEKPTEEVAPVVEVPVEVAPEVVPEEMEEEAPAEEPVVEEDKDAKIAELEARIAELEAENADLKAKLDESEAKAEEMSSQLKMSAAQPASKVAKQTKKPYIKLAQF